MVNFAACTPLQYIFFKKYYIAFYPSYGFVVAQKHLLLIRKGCIIFRNATHLSVDAIHLYPLLFFLEIFDMYFIELYC